MSQTRSKISRADALAACPRRMIDARLEETGNGGGRLTVRMKSQARFGWLFKMPAGASKTFELDSIGKFVWDLCDGEHSVEQIIRALARQYKLSHREAEVPTAAFLQTLTRKGLIGMQIREKQS